MSKTEVKEAKRAYYITHPEIAREYKRQAVLGALLAAGVVLLVLFVLRK